MLGPVFQLELVVSARRARFFLWRVLYTSLLLVVMVLVYLISFGLEEVNSIHAAAEFARYYLHSFAVIQLGAVLLLGPAMTAGMIARERERRTIEYLFTTHLTSAQIVLGKLAAALAQLGVAVAAGLPVLALAMLLGGITSRELFDVTAITLSTIVLTVSVSLAASAIARRSREAVAAVYGLLFGWIVGGALLDGLSRGSFLAGTARQFATALDSINPLVVIGSVLDGSQPEQVRSSALWRLAGIHVGLSALFVLAAVLLLRRVSFAGSSRALRLRRHGRWLRMPLKDRPLIWREMFANRSHSRLAGVGRGLLLLLMGLAMLGTVWQYLDAAMAGRSSQFVTFAMWLATILEGLGLLLAAAWAANTVAMEREKDTWITLISAPLEAREIVLGKLAGSFYAARLVLPPLMLVWALAAAAEPAFIPAIVFTLLGLAAAAFMLCMLGLFYSFWCSNATRALGATLGTIFAATILGSCCIFPLGIFNPLYLLLLPGVITLIALESSSAAALPMSIAGIFYGGTWLVALAVHLGCGGILWAVCVSRFDHFAGRISAQGPSALSIPTPQEMV